MGYIMQGLAAGVIFIAGMATGYQNDPARARFAEADEALTASQDQLRSTLQDLITSNCTWDQGVPPK